MLLRRLSTAQPPTRPGLLPQCLLQALFWENICHWNIVLRSAFGGLLWRFTPVENTMTSDSVCQWYQVLLRTCTTSPLGTKLAPSLMTCMLDVLPRSYICILSSVLPNDHPSIDTSSYKDERVMERICESRYALLARAPFSPS